MGSRPAWSRPAGCRGCVRAGTGTIHGHACEQRGVIGVDGGLADLPGLGDFHGGGVEVVNDAGVLGVPVAGRRHSWRGRVGSVVGVGVHVATHQHRPVRGQDADQAGQVVHAESVLFGAAHRRVPPLAGEPIDVRHVVDRDDRDDRAVGAQEDAPGGEPVPQLVRALEHGVVVVDDLDAATVEHRPGIRAPHDRASHGLPRIRAGRRLLAVGVVAGRGRTHLRQRHVLDLVERDEVRRRAGEGADTGVEATAGLDVGVRDQDLTADRPTGRGRDAGRHHTKVGAASRLARRRAGQLGGGVNERVVGVLVRPVVGAPVDHGP